MRRTLLILLAAASPALAQQQPAARDANVGVAAARAHWRTVHGYIQRAAEQLPESLYNYKPTPAVRSFAELFGHIAGSEYMFCAPVRGEGPRAEDEIESKVKDKAGLVKALKDAAAYCEVAYSISDAAAAETIDLFGKRSKINALIFNTTHDGEHYGNIITYMRMKGLVPPSSQQ
jgi:uncharacterized damage-inducible protein DinB